MATRSIDGARALFISASSCLAMARIMCTTARMIDSRCDVCSTRHGRTFVLFKIVKGVH